MIPMDEDDEPPTTPPMKGMKVPLPESEWIAWLGPDGHIVVSTRTHKGYHDWVNVRLVQQTPATIIVCQGPPVCLLMGDEAVAAQKAGCIWCKRIIMLPDGSEHVTEPTRS